MGGPRAAPLVETVLRCYPARWRRRHGDEAAELAALLIRDGTPVGSVALSYLLGAARERLTPRPGRHLGTAMCALLVAACSLGISVGLLTSSAPARAASTSRASGHAHCRHVSMATVRHKFPATGHPQSTTREAGESGDGRSC
jgi:hypothetical protein